MVVKVGATKQRWTHDARESCDICLLGVCHGLVENRSYKVMRERAHNPGSRV